MGTSQYNSNVRVAVLSPEPPLPDTRATLIEVASEEQLAFEGPAALERGRALVLAPFVEATQNSRKINVVSVDNLSANPKNSAHEVSFGLLAVYGLNQSRSYPVAMKPFNQAHSAVAEIHGYRVLQRLGVETYSPYGAFPTNDGRYVVMTATRHDLVSLDRQQWVPRNRIDSEAASELAEHNTKTISSVAAMLAYLHSHGVHHPDGQIKNFAVTPEGRIGVIDTEGVTVLDLNHPHAVAKAWSDIDKLVHSLIHLDDQGSDSSIFGVGVFNGLSLKHARAAIWETVIEPYMTALEMLNDGTSVDRAAHILALYEGISHRFESEQGWPIQYLNPTKH